MKYTIAAFAVAVVLIVGAVAQEAAGADPVPVGTDDIAGAASGSHLITGPNMEIPGGAAGDLAPPVKGS